MQNHFFFEITNSELNYQFKNLQKFTKLPIYQITNSFLKLPIHTTLSLAGMSNKEKKRALMIFSNLVKTCCEEQSKNVLY